MPARYAASPYSLSASGEVRSSPAYARSMTCCAISTGISAAIPRTTPPRIVAVAAFSKSSADRLLASSASSAIPRMPLTARLPSVNPRPADSSATCPVALSAAPGISISTGVPAAICSSARRSISCPNIGAASAAAPPRTPPTVAPTGPPNGAPAIEPSLAPVATAPSCAPCPASARGIWEIASPAAGSKPCSSYALRTAANDGPSPASRPISSPRSTPARAASSGDPVTASNAVRPLDSKDLPPRISSSSTVDSRAGSGALAGAVCSGIWMPSLSRIARAASCGGISSGIFSTSEPSGRRIA